MEKRWLASLLSNKCTIGVLLKFLEDIKVENRERAMEREAEWVRRNIGKGKSRLSN